MPVKRSRIGSSSSHLPAAAPVPPAANPAKVMKPSSGEQSGLNVDDQLKIGGFLERCHYCKKRIPQNSEVFMYRDLCAFCSVECRDIQIAQDQLADKNPAKPKQKIVQDQGPNSVKGQFGY